MVKNFVLYIFLFFQISEFAKASAGKNLNFSRQWRKPFMVDKTVFPFDSNAALLSKGYLHYFDVKPKGNQKGTILAIHGNPTWSIIFTKVAKILVSKGYRFIALDLYGYGMSDKPQEKIFDYKIGSHAKIVEEFINYLNLTDIIITAQDGGGPVALMASISQASRIKGFVLINTWFKESKRIEPNSTIDQFIFHDWSLENIINESYYLKTGQTAIKGAKAVVREWRIDPSLTTTLHKSMLNPYFIEGDVNRPLSSDVHKPHVRFVQSVLSDHLAFKKLEQNIHLITSKPVYFLYGDAIAFGPLKCDIGSKKGMFIPPYMFKDQEVIKWSSKRQLCPKGFTCSDEDPRFGKSICIDKFGEEYWPLLQSYLDIWASKSVVGVYKDLDAPEYMVLSHPNKIAEAIEEVKDH